MKKRVYLFLSTLFLGILLSGVINAQGTKVAGKIKDAADGSVLTGVTVMEKGTSNGTMSDAQGTYSITVSPNATLVFSYVGYLAQEVPVNGKTTVDVTLAVNVTALQDVIVIGYGTVKKSDATGSVTAISSKDFNKGVISSPQDLLVGKTAGVVITNAGGAPGSGATIRIRGGSSLNASNDPLIIIDGVPIDNNGVSGSSNFLNFVNPNDIETFTVLKDASATAIYGSRASNGVILITTKKGKAGAPFSVTYTGNVSISSPIKYVDVYSGDQLRNIAASNIPLFGAASLNTLWQGNTNWQKEIFRNAIAQDHNLSVTGSYKNLPYRASIGYTGQDGTLKNTDMKRLTGNISLNPTFFNNSLKVDLNIKGMTTKQNFGDQGAIGSAINMDPTKPVMDPSALSSKSDGYFQWQNYGASLGTPNPVEQALAIDNQSVVNRLIGNIQFNYKIPFVPGLAANLNLATDYSSGTGHNNMPTSAPSSLVSPLGWGRLEDYHGKNYNNLLDFYFNYTKELPGIKSKIEATAGYSWQHFQRKGDNYARSVVDATHSYQKSDSSSYITENFLVSFFGRVNYSFLDRYLLTFTLRDDGSSRFAQGNRWGLFPSAAFAWKIKEESFLKGVTAVSDLKLRLGWGKTGQQDIGSDYPAQAVYTQSLDGSYYMINGRYAPTLRPDPYDPNIKWEETTTKNIGLDFGFLNNRINGSLEIYNRVTDNLLNLVTIPSGSNFSNKLYTNVGSLKNNGVEFTLNTIPVSKKDLSLEIGFNFTYNKNEITKLLLSDDPNYIGVLYGSAFTGLNQVTRVGYPAYSFFVNKQVYDANGNPVEGLYVDLSGKGGAVSGDNADKYIFHNPVPDYLMGISARLNYKSFDFSVSTRASIGNYAYNQIAAGASYDQMYQIGYWKNFPTYLSETNFVKRQFTSDYFVYNASFFKFDNISAGYTFSKIVDKASLRVSLTVQNAFTITKYPGIDPEIPGGIDNNFYPRPRIYMLGVNFTY